MKRAVQGNGKLGMAHMTIRVSSTGLPILRGYIYQLHFCVSAPPLSPTMFSSLLMGLAFAGSFASAQSPTSEASEAAILDPTAECTYYEYAPVVAANKSFPEIWQPATLLTTDTAGNAMWNQIKASIPTNIPVKGTMAGNFANFTPTYSPSDPDCWWTYDKCDTPKLASLKPDVTGTPEPLSLGYGFDDGPNCSHNAFYDYLSQQNQKASELPLHPTPLALQC